MRGRTRDASRAPTPPAMTATTAHYVYPQGSPERAEWRRSIPDACGKCHSKERESTEPPCMEGSPGEEQSKGGHLFGTATAPMTSNHRHGPRPGWPSPKELRKLPWRGVEVLFWGPTTARSTHWVMPIRQVLRLPRNHGILRSMTEIDRPPDQTASIPANNAIWAD